MNGRGSAKHADFIGINRKVADSPAFRSLPPIARALYVDLRRQFTGYNNGQIAAVLEGTEDRPGLAAYGWPARSVFKYIKVLIEHQLIAKTRQGGIGAMSKICSLYAFTDAPVVASKEKDIAGSMASLAYFNFTPKETVQRTRQKKVQGARGAYIAARGACTQVHAVPSDPLISARGAPCDFPSKVTQAIDATAKSGNSGSETEKAPQVHAVHTLINLAKGGAALDLAVDPALPVSRGSSSSAQKIAQPKKKRPSKKPAGRKCPECSKSLRSKRADARYCSNSCRQLAYLKRVASAAMENAAAPA